MSRQAIKSENFASEPKRILFTVKDRTVITKACIHEGGWEGSRKGFKIHFTYDKTAPEGQKIVWGVAISRRWKQGTAGTVFDSMQLVESRVANRALDAREGKLAAEKEDQ